MVPMVVAEVEVVVLIIHVWLSEHCLMALAGHRPEIGKWIPKLADVLAAEAVGVEDQRILGNSVAVYAVMENDQASVMVMAVVTLGLAIYTQMPVVVEGVMLVAIAAEKVREMA